MSTVTESWVADGQPGPSSSTSPRPPIANADSLDFSDIFSFSALPAPQPSNHISTADNVQHQAEIEEMMLPDDPEPPDANDMLNMREKLAAMGLVDAPADGYATTREGDLTARERILTNMVLRLTKPGPNPSHSQLLEQANTISQLTCQLELLARHHQEERDLWQADRESWVRIAGALTARRIAEGTHHANAIEHENATLSSDNRTLKEKLLEQQTRFEALEAELRMLRPLLLLQPSSSASSFNRNEASQQQQQQHTQHAPYRGAGRPRKLKEKEPARFSDDELDLHKPSKGHNAMKFSTTSDARSEHLLLATRRIGRQRLADILPSTVLPSLLPHPLMRLPNPLPLPSVSLPSVSQPPTIDSAPNPTPVSPTKAPSKRAVRAFTPDASLPESSSLRRRVNTPPRHTAPPNPSQTSPSRTTRSQAAKPPVTPTFDGPSTAITSAPDATQQATPLDHLINASRILDLPPNSIDGSPLRRKGRSYPEAPESPTQDVRGRMMGGGVVPLLPLQPMAGSSRIMSALDVLAEQAAVVNVNANTRSPSRPHSQGSQSDIESEDDPFEATPRQRPRKKSRMNGVQVSGGRSESPIHMELEPLSSTGSRRTAMKRRYDESADKP
ncbi:hypothetical protein FRB97_006966 [Tulasnella sp. 331]|nr:hypothetical protein FRB97_006966 [Tulasnella sp. 331]